MDTPDPNSGKFIRIEWPEIPQSLYANNALVQVEDGVVLLGFYQVNAPLLMGTEDEQRAALEKLDTLNATPIVRIAFPLEKIGKLIEALESQRLRQQSK